MQRPALIVLLSLIGVSASQAQDREAVADRIQELVLEFNRAYERNDLETYFSYYADDLTQWFESGRVSLEEYRASWYELVEGGGGVEKNKVSDLKVQVGPSADTAVATYRVDVVTRTPDGERTRERAWETDVWFLRDGEWKIVHLHYNSEETP